MRRRRCNHDAQYTQEWALSAIVHHCLNLEKHKKASHLDRVGDGNVHHLEILSCGLCFAVRLQARVMGYSVRVSGWVQIKAQPHDNEPACLASPVDAKSGYRDSPNIPGSRQWAPVQDAKVHKHFTNVRDKPLSPGACRTHVSLREKTNGDLPHTRPNTVSC